MKKTIIFIVLTIFAMGIGLYFMSGQFKDDQLIPNSYVSNMININGKTQRQFIKYSGKGEFLLEDYIKDADSNSVGYYDLNNEIYIQTLRDKSIEVESQKDLSEAYLNIYTFDVRNRKQTRVTNYKFEDYQDSVGYLLNDGFPITLNKKDVWIPYSIQFFNSDTYTVDKDIELFERHAEWEYYEQYYIDEYNGIKSGTYIINTKTRAGLFNSNMVNR